MGTGALFFIPTGHLEEGSIGAEGKDWDIQSYSGRCGEHKQSEYNKLFNILWGPLNLSLLKYHGTTRGKNEMLEHIDFLLDLTPYNRYPISVRFLSRIC